MFSSLRSATRMGARFAPRVASRSVSFTQPSRANAFRLKLAAGATVAGAAGLMASCQKVEADSSVDYAAVRKTIAEILDVENYDDGSFGPIFIRLAWHASGTYDIKDGSGGSNGATMRFSPEADHGANAGLHVARNVLERVKRRYPGISYADLWTLAGAVAVEEMGGPKVAWTPGRTDAASASACPPEGRLPDASQGAQHLRDIFYKMGMNDQEIVALSGAHCFGRCHTERSGFSGPWTRAPTTFSTLYFEELLNNKWTVKKWKGPKQYEDPTGELMMLETDLALTDDPSFRKHVVAYAKDEALFAKDFAAAFSKLMQNGVPCGGCCGGPSRNTPLLLIASLIALATSRGC